MSEDKITLEALAGDIKQRLDALGEQIPDDNRLEALVREQFEGLLNSDEGAEIVRKIKFGKEDDSNLAGSKFARMGASLADIEMARDILESARGQRVNGNTVNGPSEDLTKAVEQLSKSTSVPISIARADDERKIEEQYRKGILDRAGFARAQAAIAQVYNAMDTAEAGYGAEIVGAQYTRELWQGARRASRVFGLIPQFDMTDPTAYLPVEADIPEMLFVAESTASNSANYTTTKSGSNRVQVDAKKFVFHQMWSGEMEEDSLIAYVPFLRGQLGVALGHYSDSLVLNGDTTNAATGNINLDDADPADTKHYLAFDGIRHAGLVDNTNNRADIAGAITLGAFKGSRGRMLDSTYLHDWGHPIDPSDLVYVADPESADAVAFLDEVLTVDKYGAQATVLTGEQAKVLGHPLISSIALSKTEADGKVSTTGANNVKGQIVGFNRRGYAVGVRRRVQLEFERLPGSDQSRLVLSTRLGFGRFTPTGAASGIESADVLYDISL
jgi:HK97 family phage major capsid protein